MLTICIAGGSGSGKTTLTKKLLEKKLTDAISFLPMDAYYNSQHLLTSEQKKLYNFDHPEAIDFDLITEHLQMLKLNISVERPIYSFITCSRQPHTIKVQPQKIVLIDGILPLCSEKLRNEIDLKIYLEVEEDKRLERIIRRDVAERGRTPEAVIERFYRQVKPMHDSFVDPSKQYADIILDGNNVNSESCSKIILDLINNCVELNLKKQEQSIRS